MRVVRVQMPLDEFEDHGHHHHDSSFILLPLHFLLYTSSLTSAQLEVQAVLESDLVAVESHSVGFLAGSGSMFESQPLNAAGPDPVSGTRSSTIVSGAIFSSLTKSWERSSVAIFTTRPLFCIHLKIRMR